MDPAAVDELIDTYETRIGPRNGAQVVARAWVDPEFKRRLLEDATDAIAELGFIGRQGEDMVASENTPAVHNLVVCTLCSCYPWPILGLPPVWYKSAPYRRAPSSIRAACCGSSAWTSPRTWRFASGTRTAELRYLVLPSGPRDRGLTRRAAGLVTRDAMIGACRASPRPAPGRLPGPERR